MKGNSATCAALAAFSVVAVLFAFGSQDDASDRDVASIVANYESLQKVTPQPIRVSNLDAWMCRSAFDDEIAKAEAEHGPHAESWITIYMNEIALAAFHDGEARYPEAAVIVKGKIRSSGSGKRGNGVGGMIKRAAGSLPDSGDWEYFYLDEKSGELSSNVESCATCHNNIPETDHVFGTPQRYGIPK